jgi:hypothetical protein
VDFQEADRRYAEITRRQETGGLTQEEFDEELKQLMVQDEEGRWWAKSRTAGEWYYHDGTTWIKDTPPDYQSPQQAASEDQKLVTRVSWFVIAIVAIVFVLIILFYR